MSLRDTFSSIFKKTNNQTKVTSRSLLLLIAGGVIAFSVLHLMQDSYLIETPRQGGSISEAIVGSPRFVNPVLAISQADKDLTSLIYSGLYTISPSGEPVELLAEETTISQDKKEYIITIAKDARFHDGEPVTAEDIIFTIEKIKDPLIKSPLRPNWLGVEVQKIEDNEVLFILDKEYPLFLHHLRVGILPEHIWKDTSVEEFPFSERNISPVGSGPFSLSQIERDEKESITGFVLSAWRDGIYSPFIDTVRIKFVADTEGQLSLFESKQVGNISGIDPKTVSALSTDSSEIRHYLLPRVFALFFNERNNQALGFLEVRSVLDSIIDKERIIVDVFDGFGEIAHSPLPSTSPFIIEQEDQDPDADLVSEARALLEKNSWTFNEETELWSKKIKDETVTLEFDVWVPNTEDLIVAANHIRSDLAKINIPLTVKTAEIDTLTQDIVRKRDFEILLFGYVTDIPADIFSFWHSSGRIDPGLNISGYVNISVDAALEEVKRGVDVEKRQAAYKTIQSEIIKEKAAVFLFSPEFVYVLSDNISYQTPLLQIAYPEDRFRTIDSWYVDTERLLPYFIK